MKNFLLILFFLFIITNKSYAAINEAQLVDLKSLFEQGEYEDAIKEGSEIVRFKQKPKWFADSYY